MRVADSNMLICKKCFDARRIATVAHWTNRYAKVFLERVCKEVVHAIHAVIKQDEVSTERKRPTEGSLHATICIESENLGIGTRTRKFSEALVVKIRDHTFRNVAYLDSGSLWGQLWMWPNAGRFLPDPVKKVCLSAAARFVATKLKEVPHSERHEWLCGKQVSHKKHIQIGRAQALFKLCGDFCPDFCHVLTSFFTASEAIVRFLRVKGT